MNSATPDKIGLLGLSHMGIVASVGFAAKECEVLAVAPDAALIKRLQTHDFPISEPKLLPLAKEYNKRIQYSDDLSLISSVGILFITLDTPTNEKNEGNIAAVTQLVDKAIPHLQEGVVVVLMSQSPIGYSRQLQKRINAVRPHLHFTLYHWVETLVIGNGMARFLEPERIIIGADGDETEWNEKLQRVLDRFQCPVLRMTFESAELTKAAINFYLSTSVTYANTLADICEKTGAKMHQVIPALRLDKRIGNHAYIEPGLGLSGGNLERDLVMMQRLLREHQTPSRFLDSLIAYNGERLNWLNTMLEEHLFSKDSKPRVVLAGIAYKKDTQSTKNAPSLKIIPQLSKRADLVLTDPMAELPKENSELKREIVRDIYKALEGADALVLLTNWDVYRTLDLEKVVRLMRRPFIVDGVHLLAKAAADYQAANRNGLLEYYSMGDLFPKESHG